MLGIGLKSKLIAEMKRTNRKNKHKTNNELRTAPKRKYRKNTPETDKQNREESTYIAEDIICNKLLPLLPAKSLFRFRSVCRSWNALISSSRFALDQCRSHKSPPGLFLVRKARPWKHALISISPATIGVQAPCPELARKRVLILASSNGLLLCFTRGRYPQFIVCNPATKECATVRSRMYGHLARPRVGFGFDPSDPSAGFTIVSVRPRPPVQDPGDLRECRFRVYNSRRGWRDVTGETAIVGWNRWHDGSLFAARQIHWHVNNTVLSFDPSTDTHHVTPRPAQGDHFSGARHYWRLGEMRGRLSCMNVVEKAELQVWLMGEVSWAKVYCVPLAKIFRENLGVLIPDGGSAGEKEAEKKVRKAGRHEKDLVEGKVRGLVRTCPMKPLPSIGDDALFLWMRRRVFSYDLLTSRLTELYASEARSKCDFFPYINSLVPVGEVSDERNCPPRGQSEDSSASEDSSDEDSSASASEDSSDEDSSASEDSSDVDSSASASEDSSDEEPSASEDSSDEDSSASEDPFDEGFSEDSSAFEDSSD